MTATETSWKFTHSKSRYDTFQEVNDKGTDQTARMSRLRSGTIRLLHSVFYVMKMGALDYQLSILNFQHFAPKKLREVWYKIIKDHEIIFDYFLISGRVMMLTSV